MSTENPLIRVVVALFVPELIESIEAVVPVDVANVVGEAVAR